jgi:hypothetical protein
MVLSTCLKLKEQEKKTSRMPTSAKHAHVPSPKDAASLQRNGEVSNYFKGLLVL